MAISESDEHKKLKEMFTNFYQDELGATIPEHLSSGHELDIYCVTSDGITIYTEIVWSDSKAHYLSDINMMHRSSADIKIMIGSPNVIDKFGRQYTKSVIALRRDRYIVPDKILEGQKYLDENVLLETEFKPFIKTLIKQALIKSQSPYSITRYFINRNAKSIKSDIRIERKQLHKDLKNYICNNNGIVIGEPGVGKSYSLRKVCEELLNDNTTCLYLPVDILGENPEEYLKREYRIENGLINYLNIQTENNGIKTGIIIFDSFDSARSDTARKAYIELIYRAVKELNDKWKVIVSVRTYDAKKSQKLIELFECESYSNNNKPYTKNDIKCQHFNIPKLSEQEILSTNKIIPQIDEIYSKSTYDFKQLIRTPFNLWLLERILKTNDDTTIFSLVNSEIQLLNLFWIERVTKVDINEKKKAILIHTAQKMTTEKKLILNRIDIHDSTSAEEWSELFSSEVLMYQTKKELEFSFSHNILFDYAVSHLLMEDNSKSLISFISEDPSRPVFLRPSLNYYFTNIWYNDLNTFWDINIAMLKNSNNYVNLFGRIIPPYVAVIEMRDIEDFKHLSEICSAGNPEQFNQAIQNLFRAYNVAYNNRINKDTIWIKVLEYVSDKKHVDFIWEYASHLNKVLVQSDDQDINKICGQLGRELMTWILDERNNNHKEFLDSIGNRFCIPIITETYKYNRDESKLLLNRILALISEENFPINYIYWLTNSIEKIWPTDPDFVGEIYETVFGHTESSEEKTGMGTPVLPMTSTRRQDFESCHYNLIRKYNEFLITTPEVATKVCIQISNFYIIKEHIGLYLKKDARIEDLYEKFKFRNGESVYLTDNSYIWGNNISHHEPLEIAEILFSYIEKLAKEKNIVLLTKILDIFRDNVYAAFFWSRLLETASNAPDILAKELYDLCISPQVLTGSDTIYSIGLLLEKGYIFFDDRQKAKIEKTIINLVEGIEEKNKIEIYGQKRERLLSCIDIENFVTEEGRRLKENLKHKKDVSKNEPLVKFESGFESFDEKKWLQHDGADLSKPETDEILKLGNSIDPFDTTWINKKPTIEAIEEVFPQVKLLFTKLLSEPDIDKKVNSLSWSKLSSTVERITYGIVDVENEIYSICREILLKSASLPWPKPDPERDDNYDFGAHSREPRNEAAQGLPVIYAHKPDDEVLSTIKSLASDPVPSVRMLIAMNLWRIHGHSSKEFWEIANEIAAKESNIIVLNWLSSTIGKFVNKDEQKTISTLQKYIDKVIFKTNDKKSSRSTLSLITYLAVKNNPWAIEKLDELNKKPLENSEIICQVLFNLIDHYITPITISSEDQKEYAYNAIRIVENTTKYAINEIHLVRRSCTTNIDKNTWEKLHKIFQIIDQVISRFYFSSVFEPSNKPAKNYSKTQLADFYNSVKHIYNSIIDFANDEDNGIMFAPTAHHFMETLSGLLEIDPHGILDLAAGLAKSSAPFGYNLDSLAVREVVKLVDNIMANHRYIFQEDDKSLKNLLDLLDVFARAGWIEARQLLWNLDEIYR